MDGPLGHSSAEHLNCDCTIRLVIVLKDGQLLQTAAEQ